MPNFAPPVQLSAQASPPPCVQTGPGKVTNRTGKGTKVPKSPFPTRQQVVSDSLYPSVATCRREFCRLWDPSHRYQLSRNSRAVLPGLQPPALAGSLLALTQSEGRQGVKKIHLALAPRTLSCHMSLLQWATVSSK
jgi:hypothetical protein